MWIDEKQIELVGVLTTISIGEELVFTAKFVVDDKLAKWNEVSKDYTFAFKSFKQKSIERLVAKVEKQYLELLEEKIDCVDILDRVAEFLIIELSGFEKRTKSYLEFHQLNYISDVGKEKVIWQSQYFDYMNVDRFFDSYH